MTMQGEPAPQPAPVPQAPARRPGGLTALAVLNFVFGGLGVIGIFALLALLKAADTVITAGSGGQVSITDAPSAGLVYIAIILSVISIALMITAAVGYLGMKKMLGYTIGCAYAAVSILGSIFGVIVGGFGFGTIIGLIYPVLTLILLNTTFKKCFVN